MYNECLAAGTLRQLLWNLMCRDLLTDGYSTELCLSEQLRLPRGATVLHSREHLTAVKDDPSHAILTYVPCMHWTNSLLFVREKLNYSTMLQDWNSRKANSLGSRAQSQRSQRRPRQYSLKERVIHPRRWMRHAGFYPAGERHHVVRIPAAAQAEAHPGYSHVPSSKCTWENCTKMFL